MKILNEPEENLEKIFNNQETRVKKELGTETNNYKKPKKQTQQQILDQKNDELTNISFDLIMDLLQFCFNIMEQTYKNRSGNYLNNDLFQFYLKLIEYRRTVQGKVGQVNVQDRQDIIRLKKDFLNMIKSSSIKLKNPSLKEKLKKLK